jgi:hypothetical protein
MAAIELTPSSVVNNTAKPTTIGTVVTTPEPSFDPPAATAVDVTLYGVLRLVATAAVGAGESQTWYLNRLRISIEDAPTANGPWRRIEDRVFTSATERFVLGTFDAFVRATWSRPNGPYGPVTVQLAGDAQ